MFAPTEAMVMYLCKQYVAKILQNPVCIYI